jgi:hypothetical protein
MCSCSINFLTTTRENPLFSLSRELPLARWFVRVHYKSLRGRADKVEWVAGYERDGRFYA